MGISPTPNKVLHHSGAMAESLYSIKTRGPSNDAGAFNRSISPYGHYHLKARKVKKNKFTKYYNKEYGKEL